MAGPDVLDVQETEQSGGLPLIGGPVVVASPAIATSQVARSSMDSFQTPDMIGIHNSHGFITDVQMCDIAGGDNGNDDEGGDPAGLLGIDPSIVPPMTKLRSKCWKEYVPIFVGDQVVEGICKHCDRHISAKRGAGTSALLKHLQRCKKRASALKIVKNLTSTLRSPDGTLLKDWNFDPDVARHELVRMLSLHEIPFAFLEYDGFRRFVASLNPLFKVVCRTTARSYCMKDFEDKKLALKEILKNECCRFSLTADMWTSNHTLGYMCVTCHYIDSDWKLQKRVIKYFVVETPHTGVEMCNSIIKCIQDWSLESRLFGITLDNASANDAMVDQLKRNLIPKKALPTKGMLFHNRCATHVINLIVKDGLKFIDPIVARIRESVKYIKSSPSRKQKFEEIISLEGISSNTKRPCLDVPTRWNSTYLMLESAFIYKRAFDSLALQDSSFIYAPKFEEWERARVVCRLLKVFYNATKVISGSKYPTSNLYFNEMWSIKLILQREASEVDLDICNMVQGMKKKFSKYWNKSCLSLCIPVIFDPRFKLKYVEFRLNQAFGIDANEHLDKVKEVLKDLFAEYACQFKDDNIESTQQGNSDVEMFPIENDPSADWDQHLTSELQAHASTELDRYLVEIPLQRSVDLDILNWWKSNSSKYPILTRIARDVLAVPASTVASEATFSIGGRIISDFRSRLSVPTVEALVCLQDWYRATSGSTKYKLDSIHEFMDPDDPST